jgi:hypothetical protein
MGLSFPPNSLFGITVVNKKLTSINPTPLAERGFFLFSEVYFLSFKQFAKFLDIKSHTILLTLGKW